MPTYSTDYLPIDCYGTSEPNIAEILVTTTDSLGTIYSITQDLVNGLTSNKNMATENNSKERDKYNTMLEHVHYNMDLVNDILNNMLEIRRILGL